MENRPRGVCDAHRRILVVHTTPDENATMDDVPSITGVRSNQDLIWCVKIEVYMGFNVYGGS